MSDEIAEFLRRAAQRRAEQMQQQLEQQRRAAQPQYQPPPTAPTRPQPLTPRPPVEAEIIDEDEPMPRRPALSTLSQKVSQNLDTREFAARAERLGDATEQADERMESHLHQAFDHRMGSISAGTRSIMADVTPEIDDEMRARVAQHHPLLSLLRQPQSVRNAIILSELLQRPEQNW